MSAFAPELLPPIPRDDDRAIARFLPTALRRVPSVAKPWPVSRLAVFGVLTLGFYPCHALHTRVRETLAMHAQQFEIAAGWFAKRLPGDEATELTAAAAKLRPPCLGSVAGNLLLLAALVWTVIRFAKYGVDSSVSWSWLFVPRDAMALVSVILLSLAYLLTIVRLNRQVVAVQQFVLAFNAVSEDEVKAIALPPLVWGRRPLYIVVGVLMSAFGLIWALPMMLAWAALKDFSETAVRGARTELAERITADSGVEPVVSPAALCTNPDCRLVSPPEAAYCPRCGRSTRPAT